MRLRREPVARALEADLAKGTAQPDHVRSRGNRVASVDHQCGLFGNTTVVDARVSR